MKNKYDGLEEAYRDDTIGRKYKRSILTPRPTRNKDKEGKIMKYNLKKCLDRSKFMSMSKDLRKIYIENLREEYRATDTMIAQSLGMSISAFSHQLKQLGARKKEKYTMKSADVTGWQEFLKTRDGVSEPQKKNVQGRTSITSKKLAFEMDGPLDVRAMKQIILANFYPDEPLHISVTVSREEKV